MTESQWLAMHPTLMMYHIKQMSPASPRKLRLLAVAYARFLETQLDYAGSKHVAHLGDEFLNGSKTLEHLCEEGWGYPGDWAIAYMVLARDDELDQSIRKMIALSLGGLDQVEIEPEFRERADVARSLILCVLRNPFRPVAIEPSWFTSTVVSLARQMYDSRDFSAMPILADALQDACCENEDILNHCRQPGEHVRGCWVVDAVLGKE